MRVYFTLLLWSAAVPRAAAFNLAMVPTVGTNSEGKWWKVGSSVEKRDVLEVPRMKIRRMEYLDDGTHPEIRNIQAANAATYKFRKRGIPGPDVDGSRALRDVEDSLRRRGIPLKRRQVVTIGAGQTASATRGKIPAATPKTLDSMGVGQDGQDLSYFSEIRFGSNNKPFVLVIDTGSSDTWIPSNTCKSRACRTHNSYGPEDSKTLVMPSNQRGFSIRYGSGQIAGLVVSDSVGFAGFSMNFSFGLATQVSDDFVYFPIDGIMGLGFSNASQQRVPTIMDELVTKGFIRAKLFGIALARHTDAVNDGVVNFGATDSALFEGDIKFSPSVSKGGLWEINVDDMSVDGRSLGLSGRTAVIDSGTSLVLVPPADALKIHSNIPGAETNGEAFAVPCNTTANVEFTFGGVTYKVPPQDYVSARISKDRDICQSLITGRQILSKNMWLLGDVFLKNVYSVFDLDNNRVGFARRKKADNRPDVPPSSSSRTATPTMQTGVRSSSAPAGTVPASTRAPSTSGGPGVGNAAPFGSSSKSTAPSVTVMVTGVACLVAVVVGAVL